MSGFCEIETPARFANGPVGLGTVTWSELNEFLLKPSTTTQNAFSHLPALVLITSCTSSLPNVFLSTQNAAVPNGKMHRLSALLQ